MYRSHLSPTVSLLGAIPRVFETPLAYQKRQLYLKLAPMEVAWFGFVRPLGQDFLIEDIFIFEQFVSAESTKGVAEAMQRMAESFLAEGPAGLKKLEMLRFWGHSHVDFEVEPSPRDESMTAQIVGQKKLPWFIRGIFNKQGAANYTVFLRDRGILIQEAHWGIHLPASAAQTAAAEQEFKDRVQELAPLKTRSWEEIPLGGEWVHGIPVRPASDNREPLKPAVPKVVHLPAAGADSFPVRKPKNGTGRRVTIE